MSDLDGAFAHYISEIKRLRANQITPEQRNVLEAAEAWCRTLGGRSADNVLVAAVDALRAASRKDGE